MPTTTKRRIELSVIALRFRNDCLQFAARTDLGDDLRLRFREEADHWAVVSRKILRTDWAGGRFSRNRPRRTGEDHPQELTSDGGSVP